MRKILILAFAIAALFAVSSFAFTEPRDDGKASITQTGDAASVTTAQTDQADISVYDVQKADRIEAAVTVPSTPVPATRFARQFTLEIDLYSSRHPDVEVPPNRTRPETSSSHRAREDV